MKKKTNRFFEPIKQEANPMNGSTTSMSSSQIYSLSNTSSGNVVHNPITSTNWHPAIKCDQWIVDGSSKYNLSEMCRQFEKMQKMIEIVFTPANELSLLMVSEDEETRELATIYFDKLQLDIRLLRG